MSDLAELIGNPDAFPVLNRWTYLNHAGMAPLPKLVADEMRAFVDRAERGAYLGGDWPARLERVRRAAAALIGAEAADVALVRNTSEGISTIAAGLDLRAGDRVVTAGVEFPANVYPWMAACQRAGAELVLVPEGTDADGRRAVPIDRLLEAVDHPATRVLTVSHVEYASGQRHDLARLGAACRARGVFFNVDAIQSLGAVPVDVATMNIDGLCAASHKWMLGTTGAGLLFIAAGWRDRVRPLVIGARTVADSENFGRYDFTLRPDATRYEPGTYNLAGTFGWGASLERFNALGMAAVAGRIKRLTDRLAAGLDRRGWQIVSPRAGDAWSGIVAATSDRHAVGDVVAMLHRDHAIEVCEREGRLRVSPHFYNTEGQIDRLADLLPGH